MGEIFDAAKQHSERQTALQRQAEDQQRIDNDRHIKERAIAHGRAVEFAEIMRSNHVPQVQLEDVVWRRRIFSNTFADSSNKAVRRTLAHGWIAIEDWYMVRDEENYNVFVSNDASLTAYCDQKLYVPKRGPIIAQLRRETHDSQIMPADRVLSQDETIGLIAQRIAKLGIV